MARKQTGGHPAKQDPEIAKLFRAMRASVELVRDMDGKLSPEAMLCLKAAALGLMHTYADATGLPMPQEILDPPTRHLFAVA